MFAKYKQSTRWVLIVSATLVLTISLIPVAGLWPLVPFLFLWNIVDEGLPIRLSDDELRSFLGGSQ